MIGDENNNRIITNVHIQTLSNERLLFMYHFYEQSKSEMMKCVNIFEN